jgi:hypothetical protein
VGIENGMPTRGGLASLPLPTPVDAGRVAARPRANRRLRQARSTVIGAVLGLIVLNLALAAAVNVRPGLRDPLFDLPAGRFGERIASTDSRPITIAFLGSSRTGGGIRPALVEEAVAAETGRPCVAYNLHAPGNGPVGELVHWHRLVDPGLRPDVVVIELLPGGFASEGGRPEDAKRLHGDRLTWDETQLVQQYGFPPDVESEWREANANPWFGFRFQLLGMVRPKWLPSGVARHERRPATDLGWQPPFFLTHSPEHFGQAVEVNRDLLYKQMQLSRFDGPPAAALRDLVASCREHGTVPAAFVTPESSPLRSWYPVDVDRGVRAFVEELRAGGVVAADGRDWLPDEAYSDGHHVVRSWADEYTRRVTRAVVLPAVSKIRN